MKTINTFRSASDFLRYKWIIVIILPYHLFNFWPIFSATPKWWKESIGFPDTELYAKSFEKKIKKIKYIEARLALNREIFRYWWAGVSKPNYLFFKIVWIVSNRAKHHMLDNWSKHAHLKYQWWLLSWFPLRFLFPTKKLFLWNENLNTFHRYLLKALLCILF